MFISHDLMVINKEEPTGRNQSGGPEPKIGGPEPKKW